MVLTAYQSFNLLFTRDVLGLYCMSGKKLENDLHRKGIGFLLNEKKIVSISRQEFVSIS